MDKKNEVILRLDNISQSFIVNDNVKIVADNISMDVYDNEFLVVLGPGHCGKTVLMNIIAGLEKPVGGKLYLDGEEIHGSDSRIGMVFQSLNLMPWRTVMGNVEFGLEIAGVRKGERRKIAQKYIDLVGLHGFEHSYPHQLSGGMKQRVGIARAYTNNPQILLMDDPLASWMPRPVMPCRKRFCASGNRKSARSFSLQTTLKRPCFLRIALFY